MCDASKLNDKSTELFAEAHTRKFFIPLNKSVIVSILQNLYVTLTFIYHHFFIKFPSISSSSITLRFKQDSIAITCSLLHIYPVNFYFSQIHPGHI